MFRFPEKPGRPICFLFKGHNRKTYHLCTAACYCGTACQSGKSQSRTDRSGGNRQCQCNSHKYRNQDSHKERLQVRCPHNYTSHFHGSFSKGRCPPCGKAYTHPRWLQEALQEYLSWSPLKRPCRSQPQSIATNSTARGPPAPPSALDAKPTVISENSTSGGQCRA